MSIFCTPLEWWAREEQRIEYPRLYHIAIDILSIPLLSDDIERAFSGVQRSTPWERGRLHMDTVEIQELLCNWIKNRLLQVDPYTTEILGAATAVVIAAQERQHINGSDDEISTKHH